MNREVLQEEEGEEREEEEGGGEGEEGEDAAVEVGDVVLLQALSPGRQFPPAPMLLQPFPASLPHLAHIFSFLATPSQ